MAAGFSSTSGLRLREARAWASVLLLLLSGCEISFSAHTGDHHEHHDSVGTLQVVGFTPPRGATGVSPNTTVSVVFNRDVSADSAAGGIALTSPGGSTAGSVQVNGAQASFVPAAALALGTTYTIAVSTSVRGVDGSILAAPVTSSFTTADGTVQLMSARVSPACGTAWTLASDGRGNALLAWLAKGAGATSAVHTARYSASSGWMSVEAVDAQAIQPRNDGASGPMIAAALGADGNGFVAFYVRAAAGYDLVAGRALASGGGWAPPRMLLSALAAPLAMLKLQEDSAGNAMVTGLRAAGSVATPALGGRTQEGGQGGGAAAGPGEGERIDMDRQGNAFVLSETPPGAPGSRTLSIARVSGAGYHRYDVASAPPGTAGRFGGDLVILDSQGRAMLVWCDLARDALTAKKFE